MPAHIPHTYRKPTGVYYFRYVFPKSICERFPSLGADIRFSLKTKSHAEAKLRVYQNATIVNISIDIIERYYYNKKLGRSSIFRKVLFDRFGIDISDIALFTFNGDETCNASRAVSKKDFYMLIERIKHTHADGSITTLSYDSLEKNIEALAQLKAKERFYSHRLLQQDRSIPTAIRSFETDAAIPDDLAMESYTSEELVGDVPDEVWDYIIANSGTAPAVSKETRAAPADDTPKFLSELEPESQVVASPEPPVKQLATLTSDTEEEDEVSPAAELATALPVSPAAAVTPDKTIRFADLVDRFFADNIAQGVYIEGDATLRKYQGYMKNVVEVVGADTLVHTLTPEKIMDIRNVILQYPKRRRDGGRQHRTLEDLLADPTVARIKKDMASEYFDRFKAVLDHGCVLGYLTTNPADKVKIKKVKGRCGTGLEEDDSRKPFTDEDLINILNGYIYHGAYNVTPRKLLDAHFWVPLIAMYTGMRVGEICQLQISDIHTEGMRWHGRVFNQPYIQVCAEHESQRVKNQNATRKVPIHKRLIEIGFLDYVELRKHEARGDSDQRLFRHMRFESHSKWGRVISRWFNGDGNQKANGYKHLVLDQQALDGKVFHSFRHTVIDIFRSTLGPAGKPIISALVGHEEEGSSAAYGDGYQLDQLSQAMNTLRYSDEVEALVSRLRFEDYVQKMIRHGREGSERNTRIRWPKKEAAA